MTSKSDFSAEEWELVSGLPGLVLAGAAWADGKMVPAVREMVAGGEVMAQAAQTAPEGSLVHDLFSGAANSKEAKSAMSDDKPASPEAASELLTAKVGEAFGVLSSKATPDEVAAVRTTLEATAKAVVERLGSGFWGSGDDKVSDGEKAFLARLATVLGDTPSA
jgi:hypothetical protein